MKLIVAFIRSLLAQPDLIQIRYGPKIKSRGLRITRALAK